MLQISKVRLEASGRPRTGLPSGRAESGECYGEIEAEVGYSRSRMKSKVVIELYARYSVAAGKDDLTRSRGFY